METLKQLILQYHVPNLHTKPGHVYMMFADGELVLTKSGELFGMRTFHMIMSSVITNPHPTWEHLFPENVNGFRCCFIAEEGHAQLFRNEIVKLK